MFGVDVVGSVALLTGSDPDVCEQAALAGLVSTAQQVRCWLDSYDVRIAMRAGVLAASGSGDPAEVTLADRGRRSGRAAREAARRGAVCGDLPDLFDALASGAVSSGHVDAVARMAGRLDDAGRAELHDLQAAIVASASRSPVEVFERDMRDLERTLTHDAGTSRLENQKRQRRVRRWVDKVTGMHHTHLELDPEADAAVAAVFDAAVAAARAEPDDGRSFEQLQADVIVDLITGGRGNGSPGAEALVLIDLDTLLGGLHDRSVCETGDGDHLPPDVIRRMCCDAEIIPIVLNGDGVPVDVGRARRLATREQRHALRAMYSTCGHPQCDVRFTDCRIHHVDWWDHLGPTDLHNLLPLCTHHHHLVHEGGWTLTLKPDRTITLRRPDGTVAYEGITTDRTPARPCESGMPDAPAGRPNALVRLRSCESEIPEHLRRAARPTNASGRNRLGPSAPWERIAQPCHGEPPERSSSP